MQTGVRQRCLLSPLLFLIALHWVTSDKGLRWQLVSNLEDLEFADDIALLAHRLQDMRCKMDDVKTTGKKVGLQMNIPKTKLMKVMTKQDGEVNTGQETAEEFQYLGSTISKLKPVAHAKISRHASIKQDIHSPAKASAVYNFPIIENNAEDLLFKCQVNIVIRIRAIATNSYVDKQDPGVR